MRIGELQQVRRFVVEEELCRGRGARSRFTDVCDLGLVPAPFRSLSGLPDRVDTWSRPAALPGVGYWRTIVGATGARVRRVHEFVTGPAYRANDVENLLWCTRRCATRRLTSITASLAH